MQISRFLNDVTISCFRTNIRAAIGFRLLDQSRRFVVHFPCVEALVVELFQCNVRKQNEKEDEAKHSWTTCRKVKYRCHTNRAQHISVYLHPPIVLKKKRKILVHLLCAAVRADVRSPGVECALTVARGGKKTFRQPCHVSGYAVGGTIAPVGKTTVGRFSKTRQITQDLLACLISHLVGSENYFV